MMLLPCKILKQYGCNLSSRNCETINLQPVILTERSMREVGLVLRKTFNIMLELEIFMSMTWTCRS